MIGFFDLDFIMGALNWASPTNAAHLEVGLVQEPLVDVVMVLRSVP